MRSARIFFITAAACMAASACPALAYDAPVFSQEFSWAHFYKGNTHAHSSRSDGDAAPEDVLRWYRDHGYGFAAVTDLNTVTIPGQFSSTETSDFVSLSGQEVSLPAHKPIWTRQWSIWNRDVVVQVNGLCSNVHVTPPHRAGSIHSTLSSIIESLSMQAGAVIQINHPNLRWTLDEDDLRSIDGAQLLEIADQQPLAQNDGDADHPSTEALWDELLSSGKIYYGVASDDMRDLVRNPGVLPRPPGRGWVEVAAPELSEPAICQALSEGHFYSSTGVELDSIRAEKGLLAIQIHAEPGTESEYTTQFYGRDGRLLLTYRGPDPVYFLSGDEFYVRAKITGPNGAAWTQPVFVQQ